MRNALKIRGIVPARQIAAGQSGAGLQAVREKRPGVREACRSNTYEHYNMYVNTHYLFTAEYSKRAGRSNALMGVNAHGLLRFGKGPFLVS